MNLFLTKEVLYLLSYVGPSDLSGHSVTDLVLPDSRQRPNEDIPDYMERETGVEPATLSLEG